MPILRSVAIKIVQYFVFTYFSLFYTAAISVGQAITTFKDHYPGFLTYLSGEVVMVLSKDQIQGIEFWEAEIGGKTGFIEAAAVKEYSVICMPVEVNDGVHLLSKMRDDADKANVDNQPNDNTPWYGILWLLFTGERFDTWNSYSFDMDTIIRILKCYTYGDRMGVAVAIFIVLCTIYFNVQLKTELKQKDNQIVKLVERAADVDVNNFDLNTKLKDMETLVKDLEEKLDYLSKEKEGFEQKEISFKEDKRTQDLNLEYLQDKLIQLEVQSEELQVENSKLTRANNYYVSNIANLMFEKDSLEDSNRKLKDQNNQLNHELKRKSKQLAENTSHYKVLEATKHQHEADRHRLETELSQKDKQLVEITSQCKAMETIFEQLKAETESRFCDKVDDFKTMEGVENFETNLELSEQILACFKESSEEQKQLTETRHQRDSFKSKLQNILVKLDKAQTDRVNLEERLESTSKELEVCKTNLEMETAKCEVYIVEFYEDTLHTHTCCHLRSDANVNLTAYKENQELRDQVQKLEAGMRSMELSYISKLNQEMKRSIEGFETLQKVEEALYKSQQELTLCQRRIAELEVQSGLSSIQGKRLQVISN